MIFNVCTYCTVCITDKLEQFNRVTDQNEYQVNKMFSKVNL